MVYDPQQTSNSTTQLTSVHTNSCCAAMCAQPLDFSGRAVEIEYERILSVAFISIVAAA